jgi:hypothetical protein
MAYIYYKSNPTRGLDKPIGFQEVEGSQISRQSAHEGEGLCQWKIPVTTSGIKPVTLWLVAQCLNQLRTPHAPIHLLYNLCNTVICFSRYFNGRSTIHLIFIHLLNLYQKWMYCLFVKVFNILPSHVQIQSDNPTKFKLTTKIFIRKFILFFLLYLFSNSHPFFTWQPISINCTLCISKTFVIKTVAVISHLYVVTVNN